MPYIDVKYINPFLSSIIDIFKDKYSLNSHPEKPYIKKDELALGIISGIIMISGDITGSMCITFEEETIKYIISKILEKEIDNLDSDEVKNSVKELISSISANAVNLLRKDGINIETTSPSILFGSNHTIQHIVSKPIIVLPFITDKGKFIVEFTFKKN